jgi:hypothetical protein
LIIVACHAIYLGSSSPSEPGDPRDESSWLLEPFQKGEVGTFLRHIEMGIGLWRRLSGGVGADDGDPGDDGEGEGKGSGRAVLCFSGGATKPHAVEGGSRTEAVGYLEAARDMG